MEMGIGAPTQFIAMDNNMLTVFFHWPKRWMGVCGWVGYGGVWECVAVGRDVAVWLGRLYHFLFLKQVFVTSDEIAVRSSSSAIVSHGCIMLGCNAYRDSISHGGI